MAKNANNTNDFEPSQYSERIDTLEEFKKEHEGLNFHKKVQSAICESKPVEEEIKKIVWEVIKSKLTWILLTAAGLILTDLVLRAVPSLLAMLGG